MAHLPDSEARRAMRGSIVEGAAYAAMVGFGELYFVADAVRLGASPVELGLLVALPLCLGAIGPMLTLWLLRRGRPRKHIAVLGAAAQSSSLLGLAALDAVGWQSPATLIALACVFQACGQTTGVAWASWFGDVVPDRVRGQYFSRRNRVVHGSTLAALLLGGVLLQWLEPAAAGTIAPGAGGTGYVVIFALAAASRALSTVLLAVTPEPPHEHRRGIVRATLAPGSTARRLVILTGCLHVSVYLASPYFGPHMLAGLSFSYLEYTAASVAAVLAKVLLLPGWGRVIDHYGPRVPLLLAMAGIAVIPIPWLLAGGVGLVICAQLVSGAMWGGHEVSQFTMILERVERSSRPSVFAAMNAIAGAAQLTGTMIGAAIMTVGGEHRFTILLVITGVLRVAVASAAPLAIAHQPDQPRVGRRHVLLRVIGLRPSGGVSHRPLPAAAEPDDGDEGARRAG